MEGNVFDVFRVLAGVFTWGLPALLLLTLVVFVVAVPVLTLTGAVLRLYGFVSRKFRRADRKDAQIAALEHLWR